MKKFLKITGIVLLVLTGVVVALYFYVVNNAEQLIKDLVTRQSNGKLSLVIKRIEFKPRQLHLEVIEPHFYSNDTVTAFTTYDIKVDRLVLELAALKPLIFDGKIFMDTIVCMRPQIIITKWKDQPKENFSLPEQMGKMYGELNSLVNNLNIKYCLVDSGSLTLQNKLLKNSTPVTITDYYLRIDNLAANRSPGDTSRYLFTDRIKFYSSYQDIVFPDGNHGLKYSHLRINSLKKSIEIDSCYLYSKKAGNSFNEMGIFFDTLRLSNVNFERLTKLNMLNADSALCINPDIKMNIELAANTNAVSTKAIRATGLSRSSMEKEVKALLGDIDIRYIGVLNARLAVQTKAEGNITSYSTRQSNFVMQDIKIVKDTTIPLAIGSFYFGLQGYKAYAADSIYVITFDSILFRNDRINLSNFAIAPTAKNRNFTDRKNIRMRALEIQHLSWLDLLINKKLVAGEIILNNPAIDITAPVKQPASNALHQSIYKVFEGIADKVEIDRLKIEDANVNFYDANKNHVKLKKVNTVIHINELLHSNNVNDLAGSLSNISFATGTLNTGDNTVQFENGIFKGKANTLFISRASVFTRKDNNTMVFKNISVNNIRQNKPGKIEIGSLGWETASIVFHPLSNKKNIKRSAKPPVKKDTLQLVLEKLDGKNTTISIASDGLHAGVTISRLQASNIGWDRKQKPTLQHLLVEGNTLYLKKNALNAAIKNFVIEDNKISFFRQISLLSNSKKNNIAINIPELSFVPGIEAALGGDTKINDVVVNNPVISITNTDAENGDIVLQKKSILPKLSINQISILNPVITNLPSAKQHKIDVAKHVSNWYLKDIEADSNLLTIKGIQSSMTGFSAETNTMALSVSGQGKLDVDITGVSYMPASAIAPARWAATLNSLVAKNVELTTKKNDTLQSRIQLNTLDAENLTVTNNEKITLNNLLAANKNFNVKNVSIDVASAKNNIRVSNLQYNNAVKKLSLDSMVFTPAIDRDSFNRANTYQKDYIQFTLGKTAIYGINPELYFKDTIVYAKKVETDDAVLKVYKDMRLKPDTFYKPLPVSSIQQIKQKIKIDSVQLNKANVCYEEVNDKTLMTGIVKFSRTDALVQDFKTFDIQPTDSLRLTATSWAMDSIFLKLRFNESYLDTLNGFLLGVRVSPFNMTTLNPILQPLVSAKINRGWVDTIRLYAIGREYIAHGKMKMYYHGLKATYLNNGDEKVKTFKTKLITFVANSILIRHNNQKGTGQVYAQRIREKSLFNYWLKMLISGAVSNTGVQSNKKVERKYNKSLKKMKLPEIQELEL